MEILVYADWNTLPSTQFLGTLDVQRTKGRNVFSFSYDQKWITNYGNVHLDPDIHPFNGPQFLDGSKSNFGIFLDISPDRWGRVLMERKEALNAKKENRKPKNLFEEDYLLGVFDLYRSGGIRLKIKKDGPFQNNESQSSIPPWTSLRELEAACLAIEQGELSNKDSTKWINLLIAPGSSLGGARPKASIIDTKGNLCIAKFPSMNDKLNIGAWEMVAHQMAEEFGISVSNASLKRLNSNHHTFITQRFDRLENKRIHFASAMTMLGYTDGNYNASYLEIVEFIQKYSHAPLQDLEELYRRIILFVAIKNTDDHLRNHGFLLQKNGWQLSPAYDINPVYYGTGLSLNISETDNSLDFDLVRSVASNFRINDNRAKDLIRNVLDIKTKWNIMATNLRIKKSEMEIMEAAFT